MFDFNKPKIEITEISEDKKFGRFVVEPLERGYGTTLGNSLRRIMLSSLPGAAVSQVKIDGVLHEFSSIPGVKEDVTEIIMNLKSLAIKNNSADNEPKTAYIECEGKGVVTAADIQADQDIEIMNPDQVIATLNGGKDCRLAMELTITRGRGYVSADKGKTDGKNNAGGGMGGKIQPSAILVIKDGETKLVNVKNQDGMTKILDMIPGVIDKYVPSKKGKTKKNKADKAASGEEKQAQDIEDVVTDYVEEE